jgi:phosphatidate cytidylyltransferase
MFQPRMFTALALIAAFLGALFMLPELYWATLMLAIICAGAWEWSAITGHASSTRRTYMAIILLTGVLLLPTAWSGAAVIWQQQVRTWVLLAAAILWLLLVPSWLIMRRTPKNAAIVAVTGWLVLVPAWLGLISLRRVNPLLVLGVMATVWIADTAAYFAGRCFGCHKLASHISPGKTWAGVAGAMVAVTLYGIALGWWMLPGLWGLTGLSIIGDLFESLIKRQAGLKDSGTLLPGHGGVLDRIDGLTSTLPLAALVYAYFPYYFAVSGDG